MANPTVIKLQDGNVMPQLGLGVWQASNEEVITAIQKALEVGYRSMWSYLEGEISYDEMVYRGVCATRQLAKRQITWLRGWEGVHWLDSEKPEQARDEVLQVVGAIAG